MNLDNTTRHEHDDYENLICSKAVRAGKRTYFFDVKATRDNDYFISITESRKKTDANGTATFSRQQLYLYKEDFEKFVDGLSEVVDFIKNAKPEYFEQERQQRIDAEFEKL